MFSLSAIAARSSHFFKGPGPLDRTAEVSLPVEIPCNEEPVLHASSPGAYRSRG